jgi:hypothetical protein
MAVQEFPIPIVQYQCNFYVTMCHYFKKMVGEANFPSISYSTGAVLFLVIRLFVENGGQIA